MAHPCAAIEVGDPNRSPTHEQERLERFEEILVICQLASAMIGLVEMFSRYSYHAVSLGARALSHLRVAQLPDLLGLSKRSR
ncbi:MAG: hypothetical protein H6728_15635 [Myxococcales bacterium]|nr:hypothetical protein [Myxococcales bacterium]